MQICDYRNSLHKFGEILTVFEISDEDLASDPTYFGYLNAEGFWVIQKRTATTGQYRYASGRENYATNWTNRASLTYGYYNAIH